MSTRKLSLILTLLAFVVMLLSCSKSAVDPDAAIEEPNLTDEFGGYLAINDEPGFSDEALLTESIESEAEDDDPILTSAGLDSDLNNPEAGHYHLRIIWGQLRYDSTSTTPTDWSGSLYISRGVEILRRVIRFEGIADYIKPRLDRRLIEWVSQTTVHNDGIAVDISIPSIKPTIDTTEIAVTDSLDNTYIETVIDTTWPDVEPVAVDFKTSPYSRTIDLDELVSLDTIVYLDDSNLVVFHAIKLDRFPCPRGFLAGVWEFNEEGQGVFRGVWMDRAGRVDGYLKGHFGRKDDSAQVFFGKWISRLGQFEEFIRGKWGFYDCRGYDSNYPCRWGGYFRGRIFDSNREEVGVLAGQFLGDHIISTVPGGFFQGRWKLFCEDELATERNAVEGFE